MLEACADGRGYGRRKDSNYVEVNITSVNVKRPRGPRGLCGEDVTAAGG